MSIVDILIILIFPACGMLACGLFVGDALEEFEEIFKIHGKIKMKDAKLRFKSVLFSVLITKMILGVFVLPSAVIYKLWMKEDFRFRFSLPQDFWTKYFEDSKHHK